MMSGHGIVHQRLVGLLEAQVVNLRRASVKKSRLDEKRVGLVRARFVFARMAAATQHSPWVTEEAVEARRPRHLLEDNPASG
jgi:hypothetical protein